MQGRAVVRIAGALALAATAVVQAHTDDPKVADTRLGYVGPGFRLSDAGTALRGGQLPVFPASGVDLMAWLPAGDFGASQVWAADCWGYVAPSGREYAIIGLSDGTGFVEISDPANPTIIGTIPALHSIWRDIKIYQDHAYIVTEAGDGIQVVSLAQIDQGILGTPTLVTTGGSNASHNVVINEESGFLYRAGGSGNGLRAYDLADPANPVFVGSWPDRYVHDAQVVSYTSGPHAGKEIAFCFGGMNNGWLNPGVAVVDVTDKANMTEMSFYQYPGAEYSHQGWLSMDRQYLYVDDEKDEQNLGLTSTTHIIDATDLSSLVEVGTYTNGSSAITHNLYVKGDLVYAANYKSGMRVMDVSNPTAPTEVAYFDTYGTDDNATFNGVWSTYPFFPSRTVIASDREQGLFVFRMTIDLPADVTGDGWVDVVDLLAVLGAWGDCPAQPHPCAEDVDRDGKVAVEELLEVLADWN